jgi:hypothetical protein
MTWTTTPDATRRLGLTAALAAFVGAAALAAAPEFSAADANRDGALSWAEAKAAMPELTDADFAAADGDGDGALSPDEYAAVFEA